MAEIRCRLDELKKSATEAQESIDSSDVKRELRCIKYELKKLTSRVSAEAE
jgi:hypothetical protein